MLPAGETTNHKIGGLTEPEEAVVDTVSCRHCHTNLISTRASSYSLRLKRGSLFCDNVPIRDMGFPGCLAVVRSSNIREVMGYHDCPDFERASNNQKAICFHGVGEATTFEGMTWNPGIVWSSNKSAVIWYPGVDWLSNNGVVIWNLGGGWSFNESEVIRNRCVG